MTKVKPEESICWICRKNPANSNEHMFKESVLKLLWGNTLNNVVRTENFRNPVHVQSTGSKEFTYKKIICTQCNNVSTSDHDRAFHTFVINIINSLEKLTAFKFIDLNNFNSMKNVHLYFVKLFGCHILNYIKDSLDGEKIKTKNMADSIMKNSASYQIWLSFGFHRLNTNTECDTKTTRVNAEFYKGGKHIQRAQLFYTFDKLVFGVMFSRDHGSYNGWWNPLIDNKILPFHDFTNLISNEITEVKQL